MTAAPHPGKGTHIDGPQYGGPDTGGAPKGVYSYVWSLGQYGPMSLDAPSPGISRRAMVKGAAWSVPIVALAVGAPAGASSTTNGDLGILYWAPQNTWGPFIHSGGVIIVNGSAANTTVTSIVVTLDYGSGFTIKDYTDNTGSTGWVLTQPFDNGVLQYTYEGAPLVPYAKPDGIYAEFTVASGAIPASLTVTAVSGQANSDVGIYPITPAG